MFRGVVEVWPCSPNLYQENFSKSGIQAGGLMVTGMAASRFKHARVCLESGSWDLVLQLMLKQACCGHLLKELWLIYLISSGNNHAEIDFPVPDQLDN